jgi:DNA-directed RNA polymerase specialized sigma24 family protein
VADIARRLDVPQKPLYRRLERALRTLRTALERAGVPVERVRAALERAA